MDSITRFGEYAATFEEVVRSDDFSLLEPFFTEDAVYEIVGGKPFGGRHEGRDAVLGYLKASLDGFDRRFDSRQLELLDGPALREGSVWFRWRASYKSADLPELVVDGEERVTFEADRIRRLEDFFPPEISQLTQHWFEHYGDRLPRRGK
jgi:hypothetical protein